MCEVFAVIFILFGMIPIVSSFSNLKRKVLSCNRKWTMNIHSRTSLLNIYDFYGVSVYSPELAREYNIQYLNTGDIEADTGLILTKNEHYLELLWGKGSNKKEKPFRIDFTSSALQDRSHSYRNELVYKAFKSVTTQNNAAIIDMTAGLGRDSYILASAGLRVLMLERNPVLYLLLQDALKQVQDQAIANNLALVYCDSTDASIGNIITDSLSRWHGNLPMDLSVYLDPMYQNTSIGKRSLVKKETQMLHRLVPAEVNEENNLRLFRQATHVATNKIVVKRPKNADYIYAEAHDCIVGSTHRFDVYYKHRLQS